MRNLIRFAYRLVTNKDIVLLDIFTLAFFNFGIAVESKLKQPSRNLELAGLDRRHQSETFSGTLGNFPKAARVQIVNSEAAFGKNGILTRISEHLVQNLTSLVDTVTLSRVPGPGYDLIHQIYYRTAIPLKSTNSTVMVTHIDTRLKLKLVQWQIKRGLKMIYMSEHTASMVHDLQTPADRNYAVAVPPPAQPNARRKLVIGFFTNIYPDGRKRESELISALKEVDTSWVHIVLMGEGMDRLCSDLETLPVTFEHSPHFDVDKYLEMLGKIDLLVYTGRDDGAISILDAVNAGIPVIVPNTGFNLMLHNPLVTLVCDSHEMARALNQFLAPKQMLASCLPNEDFKSYARVHINFWAEIANFDN
jgi:glycosyltransferase involved in cell wall biosynthesis